MEPDNKPLPQYICHKVVGAAQVATVQALTPRHTRLHTGYGHFDLVNRADTVFEIGGYVVEYENGYTSYSPAAAFEAGYTLIGSTPRTLLIEEVPSKVAGVVAAFREDRVEHAAQLGTELLSSALIALMHIGQTHAQANSLAAQIAADPVEVRTAA